MVQEKNRQGNDGFNMENSLLSEIEGSKGTKRSSEAVGHQRLQIAIGFFQGYNLDLFVHCLIFALALEIL